MSIGIKKSEFEKFDRYWESLEVSIANDMVSLIPLINNEFNLTLPADHDLLLEFTSRFEKNERIWSIIDVIKKKYKIGLLTDQYPGMLEDIYKRGLMPNVEFDVVIDSSIEKVKKPNQKIYELAEKR